MGREYFYELQKYTQWWVWLISLCTLILFVPIIFLLTFHAIKAQGIPLSDAGTVILFFFCILAGISFLWLQGICRIEYKVDRLGFSHRFFPFTKSWKTIQKEQVKDWKITHEQHLEILLFNGKKLFFGTQQPDQLREAMVRLFGTKIQR